MRDAEAWGRASGAQSLRSSWAGSASGAVSSACAPSRAPARIEVIETALVTALVTARMDMINHWSTMRSIAGSEVSTVRGALGLVDEHVPPGIPPPPGNPPTPGNPPVSTRKGVESASQSDTRAFTV